MANEAQVDGLIVCGAAGEIYEIPWAALTGYRVSGDRKAELEGATGGGDDTSGFQTYRATMLPGSLMTYVASGGTISPTSQYLLAR